MPASPARAQISRMFSEIEEEVINASNELPLKTNRHEFSFIKEVQTILRRPFTFNSWFKVLGLLVVGGGAAVSFFGAAAITGFPLNLAGAALGLVSATIWLLAVGRSLYNKFAAAGSFLDESLRVKVIFILPKITFVKTPLSLVGDMLADINKLSSQIAHNIQEAKNKFEQLKGAMEKLKKANPAAAEVFIKLYLESEEQQNAFYKELYDKIEAIKKPETLEGYGTVTPELAELANKHFKDTNFNIISYFNSVPSFCDAIRPINSKIADELCTFYQNSNREQQLRAINNQFFIFFKEAEEGKKYGPFSSQFAKSIENLKSALLSNGQSIWEDKRPVAILAPYPFKAHDNVIKALVGCLDETLNKVINKLASIVTYDAMNDERKKQFSRQQEEYSNKLNRHNELRKEVEKGFDEFKRELASSTKQFIQVQPTVPMASESHDVSFKTTFRFGLFRSQPAEPLPEEKPVPNIPIVENKTTEKKKISAREALSSLRSQGMRRSLSSHSLYYTKDGNFELDSGIRFKL